MPVFAVHYSYADRPDEVTAHRPAHRAFLRELKHVLVIYPQAKVSDGVNGLVMYPSPPHVAYKSTPIQKGLGF